MIHDTAIIHPDVRIGKDVYIGAYCIIGSPAEDKKHWGRNDFSVVIEDGAIITGHCTIDAGTVQDTRIGKDTFLMKGVHVGHDAEIGDEVTIACHSLIGGHCKILKGANLGLGSILHQKSVIGSYSMLGMGTIVTKKSEIKPFTKYVGSPARSIGENTIAIERNKITQGKIKDFYEDYYANLSTWEKENR